MVSIYDYTVKNLKGEMESLEKFKGNALVIVNTASKCGLTPQFEDLQKLYEKYSSKVFKSSAFQVLNSIIRNLKIRKKQWNSAR